jgi:hypothetical protein
MSEIPLEDVQRAIQAVVDATGSARGPAAESVARRKAARVARLVAVAARLEQELGSDSPEVVELKARIVGTDTSRIRLAERGERERRRPDVQPREWMVYGRVVTHDGSPATGVRVRLFDKDRKYDDLLGETRVDEFGDFAIGPYEVVLFLEAEEPEEGEHAEMPELYLKVYGARNKVVYDGSEDARFGAGRVEYFEIVLARPQEETARDKGAAGSATRGARRQAGRS